MKYLHMMKLQFLNTPHSLMTRFHMEKIASCLLLNFTWYKVITYTDNARKK